MHFNVIRHDCSFMLNSLGLKHEMFALYLAIKKKFNLYSSAFEQYNIHFNKK